MGDDTYMLKFQLAEKPRQGFSAARQERIVVGILRAVRAGDKRFMDYYYNFEVDKEGECTVTLKCSIGTTKNDLDDLIDLRYEAKTAIEEALGIGYGDEEPEELTVPTFIAWMLGLETKPAFDSRRSMNEAGDVPAPVNAKEYYDALTAHGVYKVNYISDLEKQDKED